MISRRSVLFSGALVCLASAQARSQTTDEGVALSDDYSRGEIFQQFVVDPWLVNNSSESLTLGIPASFQFPRDVVFDCAVNSNKRCIADPAKPRAAGTVFGIDINHYTDKDSLLFDVLREQHVSFVQMKTSQGVTFKDANFPVFWDRAGRLTGDKKVYRGPYHFLTADADGKKQADWFLAMLDSVHGLQAGDMAPGVDLEWDVYKSTGKLDHWKGKGEQFIIDRALGCLNRIEERTKRTPVLYTGKSWFGPSTISLSRFKEFVKYPVWVFDYDPLRKISEKPLLPDDHLSAALWQFTSTARIPACYDGIVDASVFYGTDADFRHIFGIS